VNELASKDIARCSTGMIVGLRIQANQAYSVDGVCQRRVLHVLKGPNTVDHLRRH